MNSFVSVEDDDVQFDDLDSLVLSASNIFGTGLPTKCVDNFDVRREELHSPQICSTPDNIVCVTQSGLETSNNIETRSKTRLKSSHHSKKICQNSKVQPEIEIDGKLISLDISENYDNINSLDIECLPFETVLMNYPGQVDYFDLSDKILDISGSPNPFDSDQESESFDGFSESSNSSFEGFNDRNISYQTDLLTQKGKNKRPVKFSDKKQSGLKCNSNSESKPVFRLSHKGIISPVFGDQRVTSLASKSEVCVNSNIDFNFDSCPSGSSHSETRPLSVKDKELPESSQNYFKGVTSPICYSATSKFKEKTNESGSLQQKSKKEKLMSFKNDLNTQNESTAYIQKKDMTEYENIFSDSSDNEVTFEGFRENFKNLSIDIKKEPRDFNDEEEFIGINCDRIGCTISWLESKQAKCPSQIVNNGIVFELSEFAKKIAWEPDYVAEWICRLKGYLDIKVSYEDLRKVNVILKRRKALAVNFAGKSIILKSKLASFDAELFTLPSIESLESKERLSSTEAKERFTNVSIVKDNNGYTSQKVNKKPNKFQNAKGNSCEQESDNAVLSDSECIQQQKPLQCNLQMEGMSPNKSDSDESIEMEEHSDVDSLDTLNLEASDKDLSDIENISKSDRDTLQNSSMKLSLENRISGRVRKPTAKAQESYSIKYFGSVTPIQNISPMRNKILHPVFCDDGRDIGPHCKAALIDIKLLNSSKEASQPITKGVVYELYHFFRERKASLTSLVHTLYRLKNIPFDKSHIIATMAKIHEMVKVMWKENIDKDKNMPFEEIDLLDFESTGKIKSQSPLNDNTFVSHNNNNTEMISEPLYKKRRQSSNIESFSEKESDAHSESSTEIVKESSNTFDLNSTKGFEGKITRGDIVYLYTKWLKKKMEGQSNVFVTDLSKDVEELIIERKVECIRIPVGTLMSSSVKLFEEFRKLSKVNMLDAKTYLLEDWIEDIKCILKSNDKVETTQDSNMTKVSINVNNKNKLNKSQSLLKESLSPYTEGNDVKVSHVLTDTKKSLHLSVLDDYEVEKIVGYRIVKMGEESVTEYRIRWLGLSSKDDSWINEADLNCPDILAKFWEALNRQRALKNRTDSLATENCNIKQSKIDSNVIKQEKICLNDSNVKVDEPINQSSESNFVTLTPRVVHKNTVPEKNENLNSLCKDQENISPFFGKKTTSSQSFFNMMINCLKPNLVDYQHEDESSFSKRIKVTKGEVLSLYDDWRLENQEHELTGSNKKVDVNVLISKVKDLVASKKVRNFNPSSIIDACYRMSLMRAKLKDRNKVQEYLSGDFIELMQMSQKHQDFVRSENSEKLKKIKQGKLNDLNENDKLNTKINCINNLERESLIIAKYLDSNKNKNIEKDLESNILFLKKKLSKEQIEENNIANIKKENLSIIKELEAYGVMDNTLDEVLSIANKINN